MIEGGVKPRLIIGYLFPKIEMEFQSVKIVPWLKIDRFRKIGIAVEIFFVARMSLKWNLWIQS